MAKVNKSQALASFKAEILPAIVEREYNGPDRVARREAWANYTDSLYKDGEITERQYNTWSNPF